MQGKEVRILVACGSGLCTSGVAKDKVQNAAEEIGIPVHIETCSGNEIEEIEENFDIILTVMPYEFDGKVRYCANVFPMIIGINEGSCISKVQEWMKEVYTQDN